MSAFDWEAVVDFVEKEFPSYIPVPSRDVEDYRIFNFLCQMNFSPVFYYYSDESDMSKSGATVEKPEVTSKKLWAYNDSASKRCEASTSKNTDDNEGSPENITFSLGIISEHKVSYRNLEGWLQKLNEDIKSEVVDLAKKGDLFIIHSTIMAEEFVIKEGNEETCAAFGDLNRPKEFGVFPIGFKVVKVEAKNCEDKNENESESKNESSDHHLQLEALKYFNMPYEKR